MLIKIRHVKDIKGSYGECAFLTPHKAIITISKKANRYLAGYASTVLHELLHIWIRILAKKGFDVDDETEHAFIYAVEKDMLKQFKKTVGKIGRKHNGKQEKN
jgi:hypothetical protein